MYNIILIRQKIELEVEKLGKLEKEQPKKGWFGWWSGKDSDTKASDNTDDISKNNRHSKVFEKRKVLSIFFIVVIFHREKVRSCNDKRRKSKIV